MPSCAKHMPRRLRARGFTQTKNVQLPQKEAPSVEDLLKNNAKWVEERTSSDPDYFKRMASTHKPEYFFIGCSDARLSVQQMLGCEAGELFIHRNIANMVVNTDLNFMSCLTYAVEYLKVKGIILCGHYGCGGVKAAMTNNDHGIIEPWLMGIRDVARYHRKELATVEDEDERHKRLVELNIQEQALKLYANPVVQKAQVTRGGPPIHAFCYDVGEGKVRKLDVDFNAVIDKYRNVYSMYDVTEEVKEQPTFLQSGKLAQD
ncbi:unnamed protein product [Chrysoparadoxa australica]